MMRINPNASPDDMISRILRDAMDERIDLDPQHDDDGLGKLLEEIGVEEDQEAAFYPTRRRKRRAR